MNPRIRFLLELCSYISRLAFAIDSGDNRAFVGILHQIRNLVDTSLRAYTPRPLVLDEDEINDDEL